MALNPKLSGELRAMVREVLRETVAGKSPLPAVESVRIASDGDLQALVARLLDPSVQEKLKGGKIRFALAGSAAVTGSASSAVLNGVITEKTIDKHARNGALVLAADAVLTPLARDRARKLGLKIERRP